MKTKAFLFITAFSLASVFANASNPEGKELLNLTVKSEGVVSLTYSALAKSPARINIIDAKKTLVFSERITNNYGLLRNYNISALPEGEYTFEVIDNGVKTIKTITYKKQLATEAKDLKVEVTPTEAGKYSLTCKGVDGKEVFVAIYSKTEGIVFQDNIDSRKDFSRVYDLSKLASDTYVFEVTSNERSVAKEVSLDKKQLSLSK